MTPLQPSESASYSSSGKPAGRQGRQRLADEPFELLLKRLVDHVADALAPRLADELRTRQNGPEIGLPTRRLLTLDELIEHLPNGKKPATWKAWLYQRTRLGRVPGCHKIGGRLFFDREQTLPWLLNGPECPRLDLSGTESLDQPPMPRTPRRARQRRGTR